MAEDLEGNWAPAEEGAAAAPTREEGDAVADAGRGKKRKLRSKGADSAADAAFEAEAPVVEASATAKKRRKKAKKKQGLAEGAEAPSAGAEGEELTAWAAARLSAAWASEVKASSLSPLEAKKLRPVSSWFTPLAPAETLRRLTRKLPTGWDAKLTPKGASVIVLCTSAERAFAAVTELKASGSKPLVLATHGGGRKSDQVKRQASALEKGAHLAVATPGRLIRLLDDGHLQAQSLRHIVIDLGRDRKLRDVLSLAETRRDVLGLLRRHCLQHLEGGNLRLAMCGAGAA